MKAKTFLYTIAATAALGIFQVASADSSGTQATPPPTSTSDAAQSKSGAGPGSTGNSAPDTSPAMAPAGATSGNAANATAPASADPGQSKSGAAPGGNANPTGSEGAGQPSAAQK